MKVLSLLQPWATLVVIGAKKIETRGWKPRQEVTNVIKKEGFLIHASQNIDEAKILCGIPGIEPFKQYIRYYTDLPTGAIIGHVQFRDAITTSTNYGMTTIEKWAGDHWQIEKQFGDYSDKRFGWLLSDPVKLDTPVACKGALNLWDCPGDVIIEIAKQLNISFDE